MGQSIVSCTSLSSTFVNYPTQKSCNYSSLCFAGGTVDITCEEVMKDGTLKELHPPTGGPWGGTKVDEKYYLFWEDLIGAEVWKKFRREGPGDILELERAFEVKKKTVKSVANFKISTKLQETVKAVHKQPRHKTVSESNPYFGKVELKKDKLRIPGEEMENFFSFCVDKILHCLSNLIKKPNLKNIKTILLVGGFSECELIFEKIKQAFPSKAVIRPIDGSLAVLKGAVIFGYTPGAICERSCPRTYGISVSVPWDGTKHEAKHRFVSADGFERCEDVFQAMKRIGEPITVGSSVVECTCRPTRRESTTATVEIYESLFENPKYTCRPESRRIGEVTVNIPPNLDKEIDRSIIIKMHFGFTEISVSAQEAGTNHSATATFNCL